MVRRTALVLLRIDKKNGCLRCSLRNDLLAAVTIMVCIRLFCLVRKFQLRHVLLSCEVSTVLVLYGFGALVKCVVVARFRCTGNLGKQKSNFHSMRMVFSLFYRDFSRYNNGMYLRSYSLTLAFPTTVAHNKCCNFSML